MAIAGEKLSLDDLGDIQNELFGVCAKWYDVGLQLRVDSGILDIIRAQYHDPGEQLREMIKHWLKNTQEPTWRIIVKALKSNCVSQ